jgi:inosine-uridine nucleoside N-ribohydrolase
MSPTHKVIIDTDPGIDDVQAIAFAIAHKNIELLALTTVFGNADVKTTTRNALSTLEVLDSESVQVAEGAESPLSTNRLDAPDFVHGIDGLGNIALAVPQKVVENMSAAELIVEYVNRQPGEISLVAIGPLTNLALALELDPGLASKVKQVVVMGGTVIAPGNVTPLAEANFINDPHAADIVLGAGWPITIIGLDVTMKVSLFDSDLANVREKHPSVGEFIWNSSRHYVDFYKAHYPQEREVDPSTPMHDASALVYLVEPSLFELVSGPARVICEGIAIGQLAIDRSNRKFELPDWENRPTINAAVGVQGPQVKDVFVDTLLDYSW